MKKMFLLAAGIAALATGAFAQTVVVGSGAGSQSNAGNEYSTLGGAGSIGPGAALSGSTVRTRNYSAGIGIGSTIGLLSGAATSTVATGESDTVNGSISTGQAGGFSGSATTGGGVSNAFAFGGLGFTFP